MTSCAAIFLALFLLVAGGLRADQIEMRNGDRYAGKLITMTAESIVLQSEVLGRITLPRAKVATISLGDSAAPRATPPANPAKAAPPAPTNATANADVAAALRQLGANTNFIEQVRKQFLGGAGPEANNKYDEMVAGLFSGKFDMTSLRAEAKVAADQIRALKRQGGEVGETLDSYLAILDNFLKESGPSAVVAPAAPAPAAAAAISLVR